jgi:hypothetical protein
MLLLEVRNLKLAAAKPQQTSLPAHVPSRPLIVGEVVASYEIELPKIKGMEEGLLADIEERRMVTGEGTHSEGEDVGEQSKRLRG